MAQFSRVAVHDIARQPISYLNNPVSNEDYLDIDVGLTYLPVGQSDSDYSQFQSFGVFADVGTSKELDTATRKLASSKETITKEVALKNIALSRVRTLEKKKEAEITTIDAGSLEQIVQNMVQKQAVLQLEVTKLKISKLGKDHTVDLHSSEIRQLRIDVQNLTKENLMLHDRVQILESENSDLVSLQTDCEIDASDQEKVIRQLNSEKYTESKRQGEQNADLQKTIRIYEHDEDNVQRGNLEEKMFDKLSLKLLDPAFKNLTNGTILSIARRTKFKDDTEIQETAHYRSIMNMFAAEHFKEMSQEDFYKVSKLIKDDRNDTSHKLKKKRAHRAVLSEKREKRNLFLRICWKLVFGYDFNTDIV